MKIESIGNNALVVGEGLKTSKECKHIPAGAMQGHYNCAKCGELLGFDGLWINEPAGSIWKWNDDATDAIYEGKA